MRSAAVYRNGIYAGTLVEEAYNAYVFRYDDAYFRDREQAPVSLTLPKSQQEYRSEHLFPFFSNMLSEGENRKLQCRLLNIDEKDHFGLLLHTAGVDTIGCVTVKGVSWN